MSERLSQSSPQVRFKFRVVFRDPENRLEMEPYDSEARARMRARALDELGMKQIQIQRQVVSNWEFIT